MAAARERGGAALGRTGTGEGPGDQRQGTRRSLRGEMSTAGALLTYTALCLTPVLVFGVVDAVLSPADNRLARFGDWAFDRAVRRRRSVPLDPFATLSVQLRLERLARELEELAARPRQAARSHHLRVAAAAYDDVLVEACRLAGIPTTLLPPGRPGRLERETALRARGWNW